MDPKDAPDFNPATAREPDPATMNRLMLLASRELMAREEAQQQRDHLRDAVRDAKLSGHSYTQIMEATGLSLGTVQRMVK